MVFNYKDDISDDIANDSILIYGPIGVGKSVLSKMVSEKTGMPLVSLDDQRQLKEYYDTRKYFDFKGFELHLVRSVLTNLKEPSVISFGAGHTVYEREEMFEKVRFLFNKFKNRYFLIPSDDNEESEKFLYDKIVNKNIKNIDEPLHVNKHFIRSDCNKKLASTVFYIKDKDFKKICDEMLEAYKKR